MRSPILAAAIVAILPLLALAQSSTVPAATTTAATQSTAQEREADFYRQIYARYKAQILKDVKAGDTAALTKTTHTFNESLGGKLLLVHVSRVDGEGKYTSVLNLTLNPDKPAKLAKISYVNHDKVHVTNLHGEIQIETNQLPRDRKTPGKLLQYEDDVYITMCLAPLPAATQPAPASTTTATQPTAQEREADFYRQIYARYKAQILKDVKAGDTAALTKTTHTFNESLGGNLLLVQVTRVDGEGKYTSVLNLTLNPDKPAKLDKIHHGNHDKVEVTNVDGEIQIETSHLPWDLKAPGKLPQYEDDVYITMCLSPLPAATQPAPASTAPGTPVPAK